MMRALLVNFLLASMASAFVPQQNRAFHSFPLQAKITGDDFQSDFPSDDSYKGDIDWDSEWKKVVANKDQPIERPGKDFYKSKAEISAIKAANKASEKVVEAASSIPSLPSFDSIKGDWKFWIGVLAIVSVGFSLLSASGQQQVYSGGDSFYI